MFFALALAEQLFPPLAKRMQERLEVREKLDLSALCVQQPTSCRIAERIVVLDPCFNHRRTLPGSAFQHGADVEPCHSEW